MSLNLSKDLSLPLEASTWVISYLAKRGAGKTYDAAVQAEEMLKNNIPIVVLDGMGIWWGLRASADGKGAGLPVVVFGGEHADLPLVAEKIPETARAIVESNISCVLDLSGISKYAARKIVGDFLKELYQINRVDRHTFIEEADLWAPQKPIGNDENLCLSEVDNFVRRGGNHNLGCTLITQRSAVLNKNILTQSDCLVILRILAPQDKAAVQAWVSEQTDKDKTALNEWYDSLKTLENGEAWVWHPEKPVIYVRTKYRLRTTFHATREFIRSPQAGKLVLMDVGDFVSKFRTVFQDKTPVPEADDKNLLRSVSELGLKMTRQEAEIKELTARKESLEKIFKEEKALLEAAQKEAGVEKKRADDLLEKLSSYETLGTALRKVIGLEVDAQTVDIDELHKIVKEEVKKIGPTQLLSPAGLVVDKTEADLEVVVHREKVTAEESTLRGQIAMLIVDGALDSELTTRSVIGKLRQSGWPAPEKGVGDELLWYTKQHILNHDIKSNGSHGWKVRDKERVRVREA